MLKNPAHDALVGDIKLSQLSHRQVLALAGPIILSNMTAPLVGIVDTAVVGHLPNPAFIGAVALGAAVFSFVFWSFGFLRMGTTGFVAQAQGMGDQREIRTVLARGLLLAVALGTGLIVLQDAVVHIALAVLDSTPEIESLTAEYIRLRIWAAPAALSNYALLGVLIGLQRSGLVLLLQLLLNLANMGLDVLFVVGLGFAVRGVALASVLSEYLAALVGLWVIYRALWPSRQPWFYPLWDSRAWWGLVSVNLNIFLRTLFLSVAFFYFTLVGARFGPTILAANAVLIQYINLMAFGLDGFAHAAEALTGGAYGARQRTRFIQAVRLSTAWAFATAVLYSILYWSFGAELAALLTDHPPVLEAAAQYLPWLAVAPLLSVWSFQLDGIFIGTTRAREMRNAALISLLLFIPCTELLAGQWGNHGLWLALMVLMLLRASSLLYYFPRLLAPLR